MSYTVRSGDTLSGIASRNGLSLGALERANPQITDPDNIYVGEQVNIPGQSDGFTPSGSAYYVRPGDSMSAIAGRFGISLGALVSANPQVTNPNTIYVGQRLTIPGGSGASASAPAPASSGGSSYTVRSGDTMGGIASRFGVSLAALRQANPQVTNPNLIYVGQTLRIPGGQGAPAPSSPSSTGGRYTVRSGDTMSAIASRFGVSLWALEQANPQVSNPNQIYVGQQLNIPGGGPVTGAPPPSSSGPAPQGFHALTPAEFQAIAPNLGSKAGLYTPYLNQAMVRFGITTPQREAAFLAQITEETAGFDTLVEYASGWEYEGRTDLGNTQPGDGPRYKGRGAIQLTGRANYASYGAKLGLDLIDNPDLAADPSVAFLIAGQYWADHGLNQLADAGDFIDITRRINGGTNGESAREYYWAIARRELGI